MDCEERMEKSIDVLKGEFRGMRTGRANPGLVENVRVEAYGTQSPLKQLANIGAPEPSLLVIKPYDPSILGDIERAIHKSDVGITPASDGKVIRLAIPPLSEQRRRQLVHRAKEVAEESRVSIRNVRRDGIKAVDAIPDAGFPEDERDRVLKEIEDLTKKYSGAADQLLERKTAELMEV
ncbi:MAG: ribosome recycling factor [Planctomycetes bacterium]|nr:ribosome recycling factor [Planctomycetota bacterium]